MRSSSAARCVSRHVAVDYITPLRLVEARLQSVSAKAATLMTLLGCKEAWLPGGVHPEHLLALAERMAQLETILDELAALGAPQLAPSVQQFIQSQSRASSSWGALLAAVPQPSQGNRTPRMQTPGRLPQAGPILAARVGSASLSSMPRPNLWHPAVPSGLSTPAVPQPLMRIGTPRTLDGWQHSPPNQLPAACTTGAATGMPSACSITAWKSGEEGQLQSQTPQTPGPARALSAPVCGMSVPPVAIFTSAP